MKMEPMPFIFTVKFVNSFAYIKNCTLFSFTHCIVINFFLWYISLSFYSSFFSPSIELYYTTNRRSKFTKIHHHQSFSHSTTTLWLVTPQLQGKRPNYYNALSKKNSQTNWSKKPMIKTKKIGSQFLLDDPKCKYNQTEGDTPSLTKISFIQSGDPAAS